MLSVISKPEVKHFFDQAEETCLKNDRLIEQNEKYFTAFIEEFDYFNGLIHNAWDTVEQLEKTPQDKFLTVKISMISQFFRRLIGEYASPQDQQQANGFYINILHGTPESKIDAYYSLIHIAVVASGELLNQAKSCHAILDKRMFIHQKHQERIAQHKDIVEYVLKNARLLNDCSFLQQYYCYMIADLTKIALNGRFLQEG